MNEIQIFKSDVFGEVRTLTNEKGETFFVGNDVAKALGYTNLQKAIRDHVDSDDKGVNEMVTPGGTQKAIFINESGLYALILQSKLEQARVFKRWLRYAVRAATSCSPPSCDCWVSRPSTAARCCSRPTA